MRTVVLVIFGCVIAAFVATAVLVDFTSTPPLPRVGPGVEPICAEAMQRSAPDLSWIAAGRDEEVRRRGIHAVTFGELPLYDHQVVRIAGLLHVEFEWVRLYPSRTALVQGWRAPWVSLNTLWPGEPYWASKGPSISDRCAVVEGKYVSGPGGHMAMSDGTIAEVLRLDVWSIPHRPFITTPPPPGRVRHRID